MTISATPPSLIDGLRPVDRSFESWWVRPGSATAVELHAGDRVCADSDGLFVAIDFLKVADLRRKRDEAFGPEPGGEPPT